MAYRYRQVKKEYNIDSVGRKRDKNEQSKIIWETI